MEGLQPRHPYHGGNCAKIFTPKPRAQGPNDDSAQDPPGVQHPHGLLTRHGIEEVLVKPRHPVRASKCLKYVYGGVKSHAQGQGTDTARAIQDASKPSKTLARPET